MIVPSIDTLNDEALRFLQPGGFALGPAVKTGDWLEKHEQWPLAWRLWARAGLEKQAETPFRDMATWDGRDFARRIVVARRMRHVGAELRLVRFLPRLVEQGGQVVAYLDPRVAPLARRSFPGVDVRILAELIAHPGADFGPDDRAAGFEDLGAAFAPDRATVAASWRPLIPDPARTAQARAFTGGGGIGVSWASDNPKKRPPALDQWGELFDALPGPILSLQYSPAADDLALLSDLSGRFLHDPAIEPRHDLEGHAAQIAAVDVVVTVSNTAAHMAGALGKACVVILDDEQIGIWPVTGDRVAWYPSLRLVRRNQRPWSAVMAEAAAVARSLVGSAGLQKISHGR
ncbi:hypothetical protein ASG17_14795 [Brevundimonas sp. Leaf363]|uniref:hypothetical protein n=1 Tax=Brevundimonas sp. Leaf363 TaxID=1736353 RepID=UPI0006FBE717|nr:hypothetical protein [Brevundimonas sp. Leaf363]KQS53776.1 hypothetical protein ASG17_14795 [Brevundimonas sp. Leaf363]